MAIITFPWGCWIGLAAGANEVTAPGYARQAATLAYAVDGVILSNLESQQWQHATQSWGVINTAQFWDSPTGGVMRGTVAVNVPLLIDMYDIARIPASGVTVTYSKTNRGFGTSTYGTYGFGTYRTFFGTIVGVRPYGSLLYGSNVYGGYTAGVVLERAFDQQTHVCEPGTWAPGPFALAA